MSSTLDWRQTRRGPDRICFFVRVGFQTYPLRLLQQGADVQGWLRRTDYRGPLPQRRDGWRIVWASTSLDHVKAAALDWASEVVTAQLDFESNVHDLNPNHSKSSRPG